MNMDNTLGALYLGVMWICDGTLGAATLQMYYYYDRFINDRLWIKLLVLITWLWDTVQQALLIYAGYVYLVTNYNNPNSVYNIALTLKVAIVFNFQVILFVQLYLLYRVWILSKGKLWLVIGISASILLEFILTTYFHVDDFKSRTFPELMSSSSWIAKLSLSINTITDILFTVSLIVLLQRSKTGFRGSNGIITKLTVFAINTGLLTSILAIAVIITMQIYPYALIYLALYCCSSKLYTNTLLATLNFRMITERVAEVQLSMNTELTVLDRIPRKVNEARVQRMLGNRGVKSAIRVETDIILGEDDISFNETNNSKV
ncbi:hypothetical protein PNOK_0878300 [Pyrrhoderma noxium]|uniref:DUF6534 domain-containing protein n=1 Tax=Pyrrhoderma noxium TaxID=2282107 RepID=A0A286U8N3_9AGAM|nr:hypothetical protein PNOK_0878300 [Pyrrhoderma noxium]